MGNSTDTVELRLSFRLKCCRHCAARNRCFRFLYHREVDITSQYFSNIPIQAKGILRTPQLAFSRTPTGKKQWWHSWIVHECIGVHRTIKHFQYTPCCHSSRQNGLYIVPNASGSVSFVLNVSFSFLVCVHMDSKKAEMNCCCPYIYIKFIYI